MSRFQNNEWLAQVTETVIDPDRIIVDPHHHLWPEPERAYSLDEFLADTSDGHNVQQTIFMECTAAYRKSGPDHLKPVGETEFVTALAERSAADPSRATIVAIIAHADLRLPQLDEVLDAHVEASRGLFRGIRHAGPADPNPETLSIPGRFGPGLYANEDFRAGVARLGERGLTYDTWHFHHQNRDYMELVRAVPGTNMILDHFGTPLGVGQYAGKRDEIFETWKSDIKAISAYPNVYAKLGGLAMPDNGFGWNRRDTPPTSDEFVSAQARYYHHTIECFGPERCMFESNFPVDRQSIGYRVLWNGLKKIAARYSDDEQDMMFSGTARKVYKV